MDWSILVIIVQLVFLEGILSIDNAAVLGALVTPLPSDQKVPWPPRLARLGQLLDPLLGKQRMAGLRVGLLGAYLGRGLMLAAASLIISNPWLKLLGAAYLIRLALDILSRKPVPPAVFTNHQIITPENVDHFYPNDILLTMPA